MQGFFLRAVIPGQSLNCIDEFQRVDRRRHPDTIIRYPGAAII